jgi:MFS family permease
MNTAWALGVVLGPTIGGGLADAFGDPVPYLLCSVLAAATLVAIRSRQRLRVA